MKTGKKEAVSPVIAVILMVAITVVLAAVLYVMVANIIDPDVKPPEAFAASSEKKNGYWKVEVTKGSLASDKLGCKLTSDLGELQYWLGIDASADAPLESNESVAIDPTADSGWSIHWLDNNKNDKLDSGDVLWFEQPANIGDYTIEVYSAGDITWSRDVIV